MPISTEPGEKEFAIPTRSLQAFPLHAFPALEHFRVQHIPPAAYYIPDFISPEEEEYLLRKIGESPQPKWKTVGTGRRLQYWGGSLSKSGVLLPEPLPDFLTTFPDLTERIDGFLDIASGRSGGDVKRQGWALDINQVLINEYQRGQGIAPHEDGTAFKPLVATISLGSHTVLDIYHYLSTTSPSPPMTASEIPPDEGGLGRPIAAIPLAHLLLLPRSLLILSSSLYASHLHAISARTEDVIFPSRKDSSDAGGIAIANADLLGDATIVDSLREQGRWTGSRGNRTSLTFRHAQKVLKGGASRALGHIRRG